MNMKRVGLLCNCPIRNMEVLVVSWKIPDAGVKKQKTEENVMVGGHWNTVELHLDSFSF